MMWFLLIVVVMVAVWGLLAAATGGRQKADLRKRDAHPVDPTDTRGLDRFQSERFARDEWEGRPD